MGSSLILAVDAHLSILLWPCAPEVCASEKSLESPNAIGDVLILSREAVAACSRG